MRTGVNYVCRGICHGAVVLENHPFVRNFARLNPARRFTLAATGDPPPGCAAFSPILNTIFGWERGDHVNSTGPLGVLAPGGLARLGVAKLGFWLMQARLPGATQIRNWRRRLPSLTKHWAHVPSILGAYLLLSRQACSPAFPGCNWGVYRQYEGCNG